MPTRELLAILNPAADRGRAVRLVPVLERLFREAGARVQIQSTRAPGHAAELAEGAAAEGWPGVVAAGGDGMVHEVVNGLMRAAGEGATVPLGVLAAGSGNDFARALELPPRLPDQVSRVLAAEPRAVDVGWVRHLEAERGSGGWHFVNGVGLGFDAQVAVEASRIRRLRGVAIYAAAVARVLRRLDPPRMRVTVGGREIADRRLILTTVANGGRHGGSFWLCPDARLDDGVFDVLVADARGIMEVLTLLPRVVRGTHLAARGVEIARGRQVSVRSEHPLPLHADGELVASGVRALDAELLPGRLRVLA